MAEEPIKLFSTMSERYPQTNDVDTAQMATRAVISAIPVFGGPVNEVLSLVIAPAVSQRRDDWFKELADVVEEIKGRVENFQPENLTHNEAFISATIQASKIALGTHKTEKRKLLKNVLVKIGSGCDVSEDMLEIYLQMIEEFTPSHIRILYFLWTCNSRLAEKNGGDLPIEFGDFQDVLDDLEPDFSDQSELVARVIDDLRRLGLITLANIKHAFPQQVMTNTGVSFLRFVLAPDELPH